MKLEIKGICYSYEQTEVLHDISFNAAAGEFISILGPSGCGKSTFLNILSGLLPSDSGEVLVDGIPLAGVSGKFAYMPQDDLLMPWKNVLDNVCLSGDIKHHNRCIVRQNALKHFEHFGLSGYEFKYPHQLSGGMRKRAAFLRTALCEAEVLLLDEPFGALDAITRAEMQLWLAGLRQELGSMILLVTHDIEEAVYLSDRILLLGGKPAQITNEIRIPTPPSQRDRKWLLGESEIKLKIYSSLG